MMGIDWTDVAHQHVTVRFCMRMQGRHSDLTRVLRMAS